MQPEQAHYLDDWFGSIPPDDNRHADETVAVFVGEADQPAPDQPEPDPLLLGWCEAGQEAVAGLLPARYGTPARCRACRLLQADRCPQGVPDAGMAAYCRDFVVREGVRVGRCWLWQVVLQGGRLVFYSSLPPSSQAEALQAMRRQYGEAVQAVLPLPGYAALPD